MPEAIAPVLIVGSGPAGLVLALALRMNGIDVRIIDKEPAYPIGQRGAALRSRTLELFHFLGLFPEIQKKGLTIPTIKFFAPPPDGHKVVKELEIVPVEEPSPAVPWPNGLLFGQNGLKAILSKHLAEYNCHVEWCTELQSFEHHEDHVVAHIVNVKDGQEKKEITKFQWLVGADGAHSSIRKQLGINFLGETRIGHNFIIGDVYIDNDTLSKDTWYMWGSPLTASAGLRPTDEHKVWNFWIGGPDVQSKADSLSRDVILDIFSEVSGRQDLKFGEIIWMGNYRPNTRMVDKFGDGRVFIVGDAAHVHPPHGGQGLNSGMQDSYNLAWKLALVIKGYAPACLLSSYSEERLPVIAEMLQISNGVLNLSIKGDVDNSWKRGGVMNMLGVNYRNSPIVLHEGAATNEIFSSYQPPLDGVVRAGDRAPDASGLLTKDNQEIRLFDIFKPTHHTVLMFAHDLQPITQALKSYPAGTVEYVNILRQSPHTEPVTSLIDRDGHAAAGYNVADGESRIVVVRPDGAIGAIVSSAEGLQQYFTKIFS